MFATFGLLGNLPAFKDWLIMQVRGFTMEFIEAFNKIKEMLSCPELFFGFRCSMIVFVCSSSIGVKLNTVLSLFMFK